MVNGSAGAFLQAQRRRHKGWGLPVCAHGAHGLAPRGASVRPRPHTPRREPQGRDLHGCGLTNHRISRSPSTDANGAGGVCYLHVIAISFLGNLIVRISETIFLADTQIEMARMMTVLDADLFNNIDDTGDGEVTEAEFIISSNTHSLK